MKKIKRGLLIFTFFSVLFYLFSMQLLCFCKENSKTVIITKEDIINTKAHTLYPVVFSKKNLKDIEMMEKRHFPRTYPEFSDGERLKNLEFELFGRKWEFSPQEDRINKLLLASTNAMLTGMSLPATISSRRTAKRMMNNSVQLRQKDNVGLIDGFLRLISPEKYEQFRNYSDNLYNKYD